MADALPRPRAAIINCLSCSRPIDKHSSLPVVPGYSGCLWTPNDIAWALLFGELTPPPEKPARRPLGSWE